MSSLLTLDKFLERTDNLIKDKAFNDLFFFIYTDGIGWAEETFPTTLEDKEKMYTSQMWWNIAMNSTYRTGVKQKDIKFSCIFSPNEFLKNPKAVLEEIKKLSENLEYKLKDNDVFKLKKNLYSK